MVDPQVIERTVAVPVPGCHRCPYRAPLCVTSRVSPDPRPSSVNDGSAQGRSVGSVDSVGPRYESTRDPGGHGRNDEGPWNRLPSRDGGDVCVIGTHVCTRVYVYVCIPYPFVFRRETGVSFPQ